MDERTTIESPRDSFDDTVAVVHARKRASRIRFAMLAAVAGGAMLVNAVASGLSAPSRWASLGSGGRFYLAVSLLLLTAASLMGVWGAHQVLVSRDPKHWTIRVFLLLVLFSFQLNGSALNVLPVAISVGIHIGPGAVNLNLLGVALLVWHRLEFGVIAPKSATESASGAT